MQNRMVDELVAAAHLHDKQVSRADEVQDLSDVARNYINRSREAAERLITSHPAACLAVAAGVGIALGWWVKRK